MGELKIKILKTEQLQMTENKLIRKFIDTSWTRFSTERNDVLTLDLAKKCLKKVLVDMFGKSDLFQENDF